MVTTQTNLQLDDLDIDRPVIITAGKKTYKVKRMKNAIAERFDRYIAEAEVEYSDDMDKMLVNMNKNRKLIPKCLSLIILGSFFKVKLFHWFYWRYLHIFKSQEEMAAILAPAFKMNDVGFFFQNMASLQANCRIIKRMTKTNTFNIAQEQKLDQETQQ